MQPIKILPRNEAHWLALREEDITSTEAACLFDASPYETSFELYWRKKGDLKLKFDEIERIFWGKQLESAIAEGVSQRLGLVIKPLKEYMRHPTIKGLGSSFDFEIIDVTDETPVAIIEAFKRLGNGILEIKIVDFFAYKEKWTDEDAPIHIEIQVQHQQLVSGINWSVVAALVGGNQLKYIVREASPAAHKKIVKKVVQFWNNFENNVDPNPDFNKNAEALIALNQEINPRNKILNEPLNFKFNSLCRRFFKTKGLRMRISDLEQALKAEIFNYIKDHKKAVSQEFEISTTTVKESDIMVIKKESYRKLTIKKL